MYQKIYIDLVVKFLSSGGIRPIEILWQDGQRIQIDKVKHIEKAPSNTSGMLLKRFTVMIGGIEKYLYFDKFNERWFVEKKIDENYTSQ